MPRKAESLTRAQLEGSDHTASEERSESGELHHVRSSLEMQQNAKNRVHQASPLSRSSRVSSSKASQGRTHEGDFSCAQ